MVITNSREKFSANSIANSSLYDAFVTKNLKNGIVKPTLKDENGDLDSTKSSEELLGCLLGHCHLLPLICVACPFYLGFIIFLISCVALSYFVTLSVHEWV